MTINRNLPHKIKIRSLNEKGLLQFNKIWKQMNGDKKNKNLDDREKYVLQLPKLDDEFSDEIHNGPEIDLKIKHQNRYYFAKYLFENLNETVEINELKNDWGFWAWLSLAHLEQLTRNFAKINAEEQFVPDAGVTKAPGHSLLYRHNVREPYLLYLRYKEESKLYLHKSEMETMGDFCEQARARKFMRAHKAMHKYLMQKYVDNDGYAIEKASEEVNPEKDMGEKSLRRVALRYRNIAILYAAPRLSPKQLGEILGPGLEIEQS